LLEWRVIEGADQPGNGFPCRFSELSGGGGGAVGVEGNLHLDADSVNLTTPVLQHNDKFRRKLAQFCGSSGIGGCDIENAGTQPQYLAGLRKAGWRDAREMAMQDQQSLCPGLQGVQFRAVVQQRFELLRRK